MINYFFYKVLIFLVYIRLGEVIVFIDVFSSNFLVFFEELRRLRDFYRFIFINVLRLEKDFMEFCLDESDLGYFIVLFNKG